MSSKIKNIFIFTSGVAIGVLSAQRYFKTYYEQIAQEEIDSVKEHFNKKKDQTENGKDKTEQEKTDAETAFEIADENGYAPKHSDKGTDKPKNEEEPYVIQPEEFGDLDYDMITLTYYADQILTDDNDDPVANIEEIVGTEALEQLTEYEEDVIYVRNDILKRDYEVLRDERPYSDAAELKPRQG